MMFQIRTSQSLGTLQVMRRTDIPQDKMLAIKTKITRFISADNPGFVECKFKDVWDFEHIVHEKVPVVTTENLDEKSTYPKDGVIACRQISQRTDEQGRAIVTVDTEQPWGVDTIDGKFQFDILKENLTEI